MLALTVALLSLAVVIAELSNAVRYSRFSGLFWLALVISFHAPVTLDCIASLSGRPLGAGQMRQPEDWVLLQVVLLSAGQLMITSATYRVLAGFSRRQRLRQQPERWLAGTLRSPAARWLLLAAFLVSAGIAVYRLRDLRVAWTDAIFDTSSSRYEVYLYFASTPLIAILTDASRYRLALIVAVGSVLVAYFFGVRYYMFPFLGYLVWHALLRWRQATGIKLVAIVAVVAAAWSGFALWEVVRGYHLRADPTAVLASQHQPLVLEQLLAGPEWGRFVFYELVARSPQVGNYGFMGVSSVLLDIPYPLVLRYFGITAPLSTCQWLYEVTTGYTGTGVSVGATVYGYSFALAGNWGIFGGVLVGLFLLMVDHVTRVRPKVWLLWAPFCVFQLIFLARGGWDGILGLFGRSLPLLACILVLASVIRGTASKERRKRWQPSAIREPENRSIADAHRLL